jgi:hypothetical protein
MRQMDRTVAYLAGLTFLLIGVSHAQSLGDVARQQRQNQEAKKDQSAPKLITNDDLTGPGLEQSGSEKLGHSHEPAHRSSKSAEQWRSEIKAQERSIAQLQAEMERLNSSIRFVEASRYYTAEQHNLKQEQKEERVQQMRAQLDQQRARLEATQEAARKDGFGNAVYEP